MAYIGAARCDTCFTNFPPEMADCSCPVCDIGQTEFVSNDNPDEDWEQKANKAEFERYYERTRGIHPDSEEEPDLAGATLE